MSASLRRLRRLASHSAQVLPYANLRAPAPSGWRTETTLETSGLAPVDGAGALRLRLRRKVILARAGPRVPDRRKPRLRSLSPQAAPARRPPRQPAAQSDGQVSLPLQWLAVTTHASASQPSSGSTPHQLLLRVSKANKKTLSLFAEGINLHNATARPLIDLQHQACADRIALAKNFLITADRLMKTRPPEYRSAISRYYYAMYHAIRAVAYFNEGGDDKESHSTLPGAVPSDFTDSALWQNSLKDARARRNEADYDPYPAHLSAWRTVAVDLQGKAPILLALSEDYLKQKGCNHL